MAAKSAAQALDKIRVGVIGEQAYPRCLRARWSECAICDQQGPYTIFGCCYHQWLV